MKIPLCRTGRYALAGGIALGILFTVMIMSIYWLIE